MIMRRKFRKGALFLLIFLLLQWQVLAVPALQKSPFYILGNNITRGGVVADYSQALGTLKFFLNGAEITVYSPTPVAGDHPAVGDVEIDDGEVVYIGEWGKAIGFEQMQAGNTLRALIGNNAQGEDNYYARPSLTITQAIMGNTTPQWNWSGLRVDFKAWKPPDPSGLSVAETLVRTNPGVDPAEYDVNLTVTVNPGVHDNYGLENTTYTVKIWKDGDVEPVVGDLIKTANAGSSSWNRGDNKWVTSSGSVSYQDPDYFSTNTLYHIKASASNSVYPAAGLPLVWIDGNYTTGGGAADPVAQTFPLNLNSDTDNDNPGINSFSMPFAPDVDGNWYVYKDNAGAVGAVSNVGDGTNVMKNAYHLVKAINDAAGADVVSTIGYWNSETQQAVEVVIPDENPEAAAVKDALQDPDFNLAQGVGYQVYITQDNVSLWIADQVL